MIYDFTKSNKMNYDCPRCDKHHRIPSNLLGSFICECGVDIPPYNWFGKCYIVLGDYRVRFISKNNKPIDAVGYVGEDHTLISWIETMGQKPIYANPTEEEMEKQYGKEWDNNRDAMRHYLHPHTAPNAKPSYYEDVEEVKSIKLPGFKYKITLEDIEKLMLLR